MLSIDQVRDLMEDPSLSDEEATAIRDACHRWADFAIEAYVNGKGPGEHSPAVTDAEGAEPP